MIDELTQNLYLAIVTYPKLSIVSILIFIYFILMFFYNIRFSARNHFIFLYNRKNNPEDIKNRIITKYLWTNSELLNEMTFTDEEHNVIK